MSNRIQVRRDTAANWTTANPVLAAGEPALETDTGRRKTGDGTTAWTALPYVFDKTIADATYTTPAAANAAYAPITGSANYVAPGQLDAANAANITDPASATAAALSAAFVSAFVVPLGASDPRAAVQAVVDLAVASITASGRGAVVQMPAGVLTFTTGVDAGVGAGATAGVKVPPNLPAKLVIRGAGRDATTIKLSSGCVSAFWLGKTADYDTFRNITLEDFSVDANSSGSSGETGTSHVLIGAVPGNSTIQDKISYDRISIRRIRGLNIPSDPTGAANSRRFIALLGQNLTATQTYSRRIVIEEIDTDGGAGLAEVTSYGANSATGHNHYYDDIRFRALRHILPTPANTFGNTTSFYICGAGIGDYAEAVDCYSKNSSDNVFEVGMMRRVLVDRVRGVNSYLGGFTIRNTHNTATYGTSWVAADQVITFQNCSVEVDSTATAAATTGSANRFLLPILDPNGGAWGTIKIVDALFMLDGYTHSKGAGSGNNNPFVTTNGIPVKRLEIIRPRIRLLSYTADGAAAGLYLINMGSTTTGASAVVEDVDVQIVGMTVSSSVGYFPSIIVLNGTDTTYTIDGVNIDWNGWSAANGGGVNIVSATGGTFRGSIRGVTIKTGAFTGCSFNIYNFAGATVDLSMGISGCDHSRAASVSNDFVLGSNGQAIRIQNVRHKNLPAAVAIQGVGASPYTYTNSSGYDQEATVIGGTVSLVERSDASGGGFVDTSRQSGTYVMRPGTKLRITYSVVPLVRLSPLT